MSASLVGSEMCIRDRGCVDAETVQVNRRYVRRTWRNLWACPFLLEFANICLLYTSDAADDM
eukprot:10650438-Alexandrium_andersonii.AAC.1